MGQITFYKMVASGNDFLVIDNRKHVVKDAKAFAANVCRPHVSVGADGVLLIEPSKKADFFIRIINSDGSEAEACGNGYRCVGLYAHELLGFPKSMRVETLSGDVKIDVNSKTIKVKMTDPSGYRPKIEIQNLPAGSPSAPRALSAAFINTGVPHVVIFTEGLEQVAVTELGRAIRRHEMFKPKGTNVNFAEVTGENASSLRTYERGVENETLACGTGTVAVALVANLTGRVNAPVHVKTRSGEILKVHFERSGSKVSNVYLEGSARFVFEGRLEV